MTATDQDPTSTETAVLLRGIIAKLARQLNVSATGEGLTPSQASALGLIAYRGPLTLSELTTLEGLNPTMVSRIIGRLDDDRLIRRVPNENDLRSASVEITPEGVEVNDHIRETRARVVAECLDLLSPASRDTIVAALPALDELVDALIRQRSTPRRSG